MSDPRLRRINKEIRDIELDKNCSIEISPVAESPFHLVGTFPGPENSPYEGGVFDVVSRSSLCSELTRHVYLRLTALLYRTSWCQKAIPSSQF